MSLIDMGFKGNQFTWKRGRSENNFVAKRLCGKTAGSGVLLCTNETKMA